MKYLKFKIWNLFGNWKLIIGNSPNGFSLIELLITIAVVGILGTGLWSAWIIGLQVTSEKRAEVTATSIATEQIEKIKTLPYASVGVTGGIPNGTIPQTQTIARNTSAYTVATAIVYIDDPFDGVAPADTVPVDYKRVHIAVSWKGKYGISPVVLMTDIAPPGVETTAGGGTIFIRVVDATTAPVAGATVALKNSRVTPAIDLTLTTNDQGQLMIPGAPVSQEGYDVTVTKNGYSSDGTARAEAGKNASPAEPPLSVAEGKLIEPTFAIDRLATLTIHTVDNRGSQGWWRGAWPYRKNLTLENSSASSAAAGTPVAVDIDHAGLVQQGKSLASGDDVRVVFWNGTYFEDLDRIATTAWNANNTRIWFATKRAIAGNDSDENYALYYGNNGSGAPLASPARIFPPTIGTDTIGLWYFDDGKGSTIARDASGYGHDGTLKNFDPATAWVNGLYGTALAFDGATPTHVYVPSTATLDTVSAITLEAWIKPTRFWAKKVIISKTLNGVQAGTFELYLYNDAVCLMVWKDADIWNNFGCGGKLNRNVWNHIAATFDGRFIRIYSNGSLPTTYEKPGNLIKKNVDIAIGKSAGGNWDFFEGTMDTVAYHASARTDFSYGKPTTITVDASAEKTYNQPNVIPNVTMTITGSKTIGNDETGKPIPKFTAVKISDATGVIILPGMNWDNYAIAINGPSTGYDIAATAPLLPIVVAPASTVDERLTLVSHRDTTLLVTVKDKQVPLDGASVRLVNATLNYDKTITTGETGQAFATPLTTDTTYDLTVSKPGYTTATTTVRVNGQTYEDTSIAPL
ncbi:carboxypeptidase regulatory-like domain-containing protein [Candidatus Uhrbacteria bacterium]|nr:carboxypeptidase regulatory-like domain-containing protein [Candidatus Uhrbacteria bacterium]